MPNVPSVTPQQGTAYRVVTGDTPVEAAPANINGGYIVNPASASDQGLSTAENLYVDPTQSSVPLVGNDTTLVLFPGQSFDLIPGTTLPTYVNAATSGHKFTVVIW